MHDAWLAKSSVSEYSLTLSWLSEASHLDHSSDWTVERGPLVINADNVKQIPGIASFIFNYK